MATAKAKQAKKPESGNSRALIMAVATRLFAANPYDAVTIREIATAAGVQSPTIYYFFKSKDGLYREALLDYYEKGTTRTDRLPLRDAPARARLQAFLVQQFHTLADDDTFFQLLHRELLNPDDRFKKELAEKVLRRLYAYIGDILSGTPYGGQSKFLPTIIMSVVVGYFQVARFEKYIPGAMRGRKARVLQELAMQITDLIIPDGPPTPDPQQSPMQYQLP